MSNKPNQTDLTIKKMTAGAAFMALTVAVCSFGIPVPGGKFYFVDTIICTAAILFDPFFAFVIGGIGGFLGDLFFYPAAMFVTLATHGLQAVVVSLCVRKTFKNHPLGGMILGVTLGTIVMVTGYTLGKIFVYGTGGVVAAFTTMPYEILQSGGGSVLAVLLCHNLKIGKRIGLSNF